MVWVFVRLKWTLLRSSFTSSKASAVIYLLGTACAVVFGVLMAAYLAVALSPTSTYGGLLPLVLFTMVWVFWVIGPLLNQSQGDQTIDPARMELLPLSDSDQVRGLLVSGVVGPAALFTFLGALGAAFAADLPILARVAAVIAAAVFVLLCVGWSRAVAAVFSGVLNSRRGRDLTIAFSGIMGIAIYLISQQLNNEVLALTSEQVTGAYSLLAILPPAAVGLAVIALSEGQWLVAFGLLVWGAVGIALGLLLWRWALARRLDGGGAAMSVKAKAGPVGDSVLYPKALGWLPRTAVGATAAKEVRYYLFRSTLQLQQLVIGTVIAVLVVGQTLFSSDPSPLTNFLGAFVIFMVLWQSAPNVFGIDNAATSTYLLSGVRLGDVLLGKMLAVLIIMLPIAAVIQVAASAVHATWSQLPVGLAVLPLPWLVWLGLGSLISVRAGFPLIPGRKPNSAKALTAVLGALVGALVLVALIVGVAIGFVVLTGLAWLGVIAAWICALAIGYGGFRSAAVWADNHPADLLAELGGDRL